MKRKQIYFHDPLRYIVELVKMGGDEVSTAGFREFQNRVLEYALQQGLIAPLEELGFSVKSYFMLTMEERGLVPRRTPFDIDEVILQHRALFLNWYLLEREHRDGKTIAMLYLESGEYGEEFGPAFNLEFDVEGLRRPEYGAFVITRKTGDGFFEVRRLGYDGGEMRVFNRTGYENLKLGQVLYCVLYLFKGVYYMGVEHAKVIPEEAAERYLRRLDEGRRSLLLIEEFLDGVEDMLTKQTVSRYRQDLDTYMNFLIDRDKGGIYDVDYPALEEFFSTWYLRRTLFSSRSGAKGLFATLRRFYAWLAEEKDAPNPLEYMERIYVEMRADLLRLLALKYMIREKQRLNVVHDLLWRENEEPRIEGRYQVTTLSGEGVRLHEVHEDMNYEAKVSKEDAWILGHLAQGDVFSGALTETEGGYMLEVDDIYFLWPRQSVNYLHRYS